MNLQTDIDALRGHALNCAIATELGWIQDHDDYWIDDKNHLHCIGDSCWIHQDGMTFDPAHDPTDSWTLDGDGWHWSYYERYEQHNTNNSAWLEMKMCAIGKYAEAEVTLPFADFASKAEAHATARCIVWLKARGIK